MTIPNENIENNYVGNGVATTFAYTFPIFEDADIVVTRADTDGVETVLTLGTDYTVTGAGLSTGGNVVLSSALASNYLLNVTSNTAKTQTYDIRSNPTYRPDNMERALDRQVRMIQEVGRETDKAVRLAVTQTGVNPRLPLADAGKLIGWREDGTGLDNFSQIPEALVGSAMEAVMTASTLASARSLMGPWGDALVTATGGSAARSLANRFADEVNVIDYGADATGSADSYSAIVAAYAALPASGGSIFFPPGKYKINSALTFSANKALTLRGAGMFASVINVNFAAGDAITFVGDSFDDNFEARDIGFEDITSRNSGVYMLKVDGGVGTAHVHACSFNSVRRCLWMRNLSAVMVSDCRGSGLDTALRIDNAAYGVITGNVLRTGNGGSTTSYGDGPCIWVGDSTSVKITGNNFQGGGPRDKITIRGISSTVSSFTVVLDQATSPFDAGDYLVIRGAAVSAYNGMWRVDSSADGTFATVTVASTLNPGASGVSGYAESVTACCYIAADAGSCNESNITGNLFEEMAFRGYGSASLYFDARRSNSRVQGWTIAGNYYDLGETGIIISGKPTTSVESTAYGFNITGGEFESGTRLILLDQVRGVTINGLNSSAFGETGLGQDNLLPSGIGSTAIQIIAGSAEPKTRGISICNCNLGMNREWAYQQWTLYAMDAAIILDGAGIQDVVVTGCHLYGKNSGGAVQSVNSALSTSSRWTFRDNRSISGTGPGWTNAQEIPTIASATTITLPLSLERVTISGTTAISTINGAHIGREITLLFTGASSFVTGGNVKWASSNLDGMSRPLVFDGTYWYMR